MFSKQTSFPQLLFLRSNQMSGREINVARVENTIDHTPYYFRSLLCRSECIKIQYHATVRREYIKTYVQFLVLIPKCFQF